MNVYLDWSKKNPTTFQQETDETNIKVSHLFITSVIKVRLKYEWKWIEYS